MARETLIFVSGIYFGDLGIGGYGYIIKHGKSVTKHSDSFFNTTHNRMEILAVIRALSSLEEGSDAIVFSTAGYIIDTINGKKLEGWRRFGWTRKGKVVTNGDLWAALLVQIERHNVVFEYTSEEGDDWMEEVGEARNLARKEAKKAALTRQADGLATVPELRLF